MRQDERGHRCYTVEDDLHVDELQRHPGEKRIGIHLSLPFPVRRVAPYRPGEPEDVGRADAEHEGLDGGHDIIEQRAEKRAGGHHGDKAREDAEIKGQGPSETIPARVGHRHYVVRPRSNGGKDYI